MSIKSKQHIQGCTINYNKETTTIILQIQRKVNNTLGNIETTTTTVRLGFQYSHSRSQYNQSLVS